MYASQNMDEVDFTILAATSVFTELIDKCPPAEACRDAFERTAKATIKMANSRGGFGQGASSGFGTGLGSRTASSAGGSVEHQQHQHRHQQQKQLQQQRHDWAVAHSDISRSDNVRRHHQAQRPSLDRTSSDNGQQHMDAASDTYSTDASSQMQGLPSPFRGSGLPSVKMEDDFSGIHSVASSSVAGGLDVAAGLDSTIMSQGGTTGRPPPDHRSPTGPPVSLAIDSPLAAMTPQVASLSGASPILTSAAAAASFLASQQQPPPTFTPTSMNYSDLQDMDFVQSLSSMNAAGGMAGGPIPDDQMDLGFGMGWEGLHHDFSDGQQVDLFDGFFFGGQQGGGGGVGHGSGLGG